MKKAEKVEESEVGEESCAGREKVCRRSRLDKKRGRVFFENHSKRRVVERRGTCSSVQSRRKRRRFNGKLRDSLAK